MAHANACRSWSANGTHPRALLPELSAALIKEPILYQLVKKFDLVFNIRGASVSEEMGLVAVEFEGINDQIERALAWLRQTGVTVEPIEKNVIE